MRRVGRLAAGLLLLIAMLRPLVGTDYTALSSILADYRARAAGYDTQLQEENARLMKTIIEEQTSAYILDKATSLGMSVTVAATCEYGGGDFPTPVAVTVRGTYTERQATELRRAIEGDFAIPPSQQTFERTTDENE